MKKILNTILKLYCLILVTMLTVVGLKNVTRPNEVIIPLLFLPVFGYISTSFTKVRKRIKAPMLLYSLLFSLVLLTAEIINARKINEVVIVLLTIPLPLFLIIESRQKLINSIQMIKDKFKHKEKVEKTEVGEAVDESRRKFLKIAAGSSLATVAMYFLKRQKAGAAFFGSVPGPGTVSIKDSSGTKVDIAQKQPLDGYNISEIDSTGDAHYYGFLNKDGAWYILQEDTVNNTIRYAKGAAGTYTTAWTNRDGGTYGLFNDVF